MTPPGQPALYDTIGRDYGATRRADPGISATLRTLINLHATGRYLDVGCGAGHYTGALAMHGGSWTGIDVSERMLEAARRANWDALHGPRHLRSGRYNPCAEDDRGADAAARSDAEKSQASQARDQGPSASSGGS